MISDVLAIKMINCEKKFWKDYLEIKGNEQNPAANSSRLKKYLNPFRFNLHLPIIWGVTLADRVFGANN